MNFTLTYLKELYNHFSISKDEKGKFFLVSKNDQKIDDNLIPAVRFVYAWIDANRKTQTKEFMDTSTDCFAFNEDAQYLYETIMEYAIEVFEVTEEIIDKEFLFNLMLEDDYLDESTFLVIEKIYNDKEKFESFENWVRYVCSK